MTRGEKPQDMDMGDREGGHTILHENLHAHPNPVRTLPAETAQKIAAGEVIDRPAAAVRELMDNAIDSGASRVSVELENGGIDRIRVGDDGCGMSKEDLLICVKNHTTSKISSVEDLLKINTLGFRGEALASIHAVCRLEITSARDGVAYTLLPGGNVAPAVRGKGTLVQADGLFENFPARRQFLKRASAESALCRQTFADKALAWPKIGFKLTIDGTPRYILSPTDSLKERCLDVLKPVENPSFFYEIHGGGVDFSFSVVLGSPDIARKDRRSEFVFVNGRRINDFAMQQAVEFGAEGRFPNGLHPFFCLFISVHPESADFNIHPAKREVRFKDQPAIHHAVSSVCRDFYRRYHIHSAATEPAADTPYLGQSGSFGFLDFHNTTAYHNIANPPPSESYAAHTKTTACAETAEAPAYYGKSVPQNAGHPAEAHTHAPYETRTDASRDFRFLGQVLGTFLVVEKEGTLLIIDQHAAHERIIYNEILARRGERQELLVPYRIDSPDKRTDRCLTEKKRDLYDAGFTLKSDGDGFWLVTAVPLRWTGTEQELREQLVNGAAEPETLVSRLYATEACRAACKDGDILDPAAARDLAAKALALTEPFCPHGRPVYTEITRDELFRRVKRI